MTAYQENSILIPIPTHFSFEETLSFLDRGFDECLYHLSENSVSKLIPFSDEKGLITVFQKDEHLQINLYKTSISPQDVVLAKVFVMEWFDIKRDISPFYALLHQHPKLNHFPKKYAGSRLIGIPDLFEAICWAIIGQQINLTFAYKVKRSLVEEYGTKETIKGQIYYTFPSPEVLLNADRDILIKCKFSRQKIDYLANISHAFVQQEINATILHNCVGKAAKIHKLTAIKGIGLWTANYVLMKSMREMSCITYGDSGLNSALKTIFDTPKKPTKAVIDAIFQPFESWESYLNFYLWKSLR